MTADAHVTELHPMLLQAGSRDGAPRRARPQSKQSQARKDKDTGTKSHLVATEQDMFDLGYVLDEETSTSGEALYWHGIHCCDRCWARTEGTKQRAPPRRKALEVKSPPSYNSDSDTAVAEPPPQTHRCLWPAHRIGFRTSGEFTPKACSDCAKAKVKCTTGGRGGVGKNALVIGLPGHGDLTMVDRDDQKRKRRSQVAEHARARDLKMRKRVEERIAPSSSSQAAATSEPSQTPPDIVTTGTSSSTDAKRRYAHRKRSNLGEPVYGSDNRREYRRLAKVAAANAMYEEGEVAMEHGEKH